MLRIKLFSFHTATDQYALENPLPLGPHACQDENAEMIRKWYDNWLPRHERP